MADREDTILPPLEAYSRDKRKQTMRACVELAARLGSICKLQPIHVATTYGVLPGEVEAELMKHLSEGGEK